MDCLPLLQSTIEDISNYDWGEVGRVWPSPTNKGVTCADTTPTPLVEYGKHYDWGEVGRVWPSPTNKGGKI